MLSNCCSLLTDFRTVFVFALEPFLPMLVIFFDFNENFNAKMANIHLLAIKSSRGVLQPSITVELHFYSSFQGYPTCYYWSHMARWPDGYKWPFWPSGLPSLKSQTLLNKNHPYSTGCWLIVDWEDDGQLVIIELVTNAGQTFRYLERRQNPAPRKFALVK